MTGWTYQPVHAQFAGWARRTPDALAVACDDAVLTYGELAARVGRLAGRLRSAGVGPEVLVGLCTDRGPDMVVGMLAILTAGGAYVPLDPAYPAVRLRHMLDDSGVTIALVQAHTRRYVSDWVRTLDIGSEDAGSNHAQPAELNVAVEPDNLAYVIYTSGSTGRPKGVAVTHAGLPNLAEFRRTRLNVRRGSSVLQFASLNFDTSVSEIWAALTAGATLVVAGAEQRANFDELGRLCSRYSVTHCTFPPSVLACLPAGGTIPLGATVIIAGDRCPVELVERYSRLYVVFNCYGPTEATVEVTAWRHGEGDPELVRRSVPIGTPLPHVSVHVLDDGLQPVPRGGVGELYVSGVGVARGYVGQPALTARHFLPCPLGPPGARMYRTGDLVRSRADGQLEFVGRRDAQLKVRGVRIEPGEVEAALRSHPRVADVAVVAKADARGQSYLVAYVATVRREGDSECSKQAEKGDLRAFARHVLPEQLVPATFVIVDLLPLTQSGKIDRQALTGL